MSTRDPLFTCPLCDTPNFTRKGLRAHACKKNKGKPLTKDEWLKATSVQEVSVEVLPPSDPKDLANVEAQIREIQHTLREKERAFYNEAIYDVVALGLFFLKARSIHLVETVSTRRDAKSGKLTAKDGGFLEWLREQFPEISDRTARNYMNAARNAGLTSDHSLADVDALRTAMALHDKKPTDLYKLPPIPEADEPPPSDEAPLPSIVAEVTREYFATVDQLLGLRDSMAGDEYEATIARTRDFLEKFTGATWDIVETDSSATTHGEAVHREAPAKKGRRK